MKINFLGVFGQKGDCFSKFNKNPSHVSLTCLGWHGGNTDQADYARILTVGLRTTLHSSSNNIRVPPALAGDGHICATSF